MENSTKPSKAGIAALFVGGLGLLGAVVGVAASSGNSKKPVKKQFGRPSAKRVRGCGR